MNLRMPELTDFFGALSGAEKVLVGIGGEWKLKEDENDMLRRRLSDPSQSDVREAYETLYNLIKDKDYYIVTTLTDGAVYDTGLEQVRTVAPCGNIHWRQCSRACTKDIWEEGEADGDICPHCGAPLTGNTIEAETYIEEGYLPRWEAYKRWQAGTLNRRLLIIELGEGFGTPTVMRWPFEKIAFFNKKSQLYRINESLYQIPRELGERARGIKENSAAFVRRLKGAGPSDYISEVE